MSTDPIADMLTRIRNGIAARHEWVLVPASKMKITLAKILQEEGYIERFEVTKDKPQPVIRVWLKYTEDDKPALTGLKRVSKPGSRIYAPADKIPRVLSGMGVAILSTSRGVMTDQEARRLGVGGEVLCYIW
ncbi:MAG TPA: 30S ribosomal protein S8 [Chloroflexi bacterium]|nr:30S ribosomal protein S8 [Chloroflexota bacterium]